jgi:hypothetical protein
MMGKQLYAPEGWMQFGKNKVYFLLRNKNHFKSIFFVDFVEKKNNQFQAELIQMDRFKFESGIQAQAILECDIQHTLPTWLWEFEGYDMARFELKNTDATLKTVSQRVDERVNIISEAVINFDQILQSANPIFEMNQYARKANPPQNESRFRHWLLTYMGLGMNKWVLMPNFHRIGKWERELKSKQKQGAPSLAYGKKYGYPMTLDMREKCLDGFTKHAKNTKFLSEVYVGVLRHEFLCRIIESSKSDLAIVSDQPFPTFNQFKYQIDKAIGLETRQKLLYGESRYRNKKAVSKGRFSQEIGNLYEKIYVDAYQVSARPKGYLHESVLPALYGVTAADSLSGMPLGIGFSFGSEQSDGYRMLLFSMAVEKKRFCALFGVEIESDEWPCMGLPAHIFLDRGPGARKNLVENVERQFVIREIAPSWSGQSKATVETTHPKQIKMEGKPTYQASELTPVQLAIAEILRVIEYVKSANVADRLDPLPINLNVYPTPQGIWEYFDKIYRNDAIQVRFEDAVRSFLTKVEFKVKEDGVYLHGRLFNCDELRHTGIFDLGKTFVEGYVLDLCVRYVWIEWKGQLIEVSALHRIRGADEDLYLSIAELQQLEFSMAQKRSHLQVYKVAIELQTRERFFGLTGHDYDKVVKRKTGRVIKNRMSQQEAAEVFSSKNLKQVGMG